MPVYRYDNGIADLTHTNMCYRCDWCDQGYNRIIHLNQVGVEYFMCDRCRSYYKLTWSQLDRLKYIERRKQWVSIVGLWVPWPWHGDDEPWPWGEPD